MERWINELKARGWGGFLSTALDVIEPMGALGAQVLYVLQPALGIFLPRNLLRDAAEMLETPEGVARLRAHLEQDESVS